MQKKTGMLSTEEMFASAEAGAIHIDSTDETLDPIRVIAAALLRMGVSRSRRVVSKLNLLATHCTSALVFENCLRAMCGAELIRGIDDARVHGISKQAASHEIISSIEYLSTHDKTLADAVRVAISSKKTSDSRSLLSSDMLQKIHRAENVHLTEKETRQRSAPVFCHVEFAENILIIRNKETKRITKYEIENVRISYSEATDIYTLHV